MRKRLGRIDDYINASYIRAPDNIKKYIATQGATKDTLEDFWLMVWEQNSRVIVMLTKEQEKNMTKCDKYWPEFENPIIYNNSGLKIEFEKEELDPSTTCVVRTIKIEKIDDYIYTDADIFNNNVNNYTIIGNSSNFGSFGGNNNNNNDNNNNFIYNRTINNKNFVRRVTQLHFLGWPDHAVPDSPENILNLIQKTNDLQKKYITEEANLLINNNNNNNNNNINNIINNDNLIGPVIVHCSAGCGRTGTFCTIDSTLALLDNKEYNYNNVDNNNNSPDLIQDLVGYFREQRVIMVQTLGQFQFCYLVVLSNLVSKR